MDEADLECHGFEAICEYSLNPIYIDAGTPNLSQAMPPYLPKTERSLLDSDSF